MSGSSRASMRRRSGHLRTRLDGRAHPLESSAIGGVRSAPDDPLLDSCADADEAALWFHLHAEDAVRLTGETISSTSSNKRMWTFYRPVGTWAIIPPWNFPLLMFAEFVAPGLATGNSHIVKP